MSRVLEVLCRAATAPFISILTFFLPFLQAHTTAIPRLALEVTQGLVCVIIHHSKTSFLSIPLHFVQIFTHIAVLPCLHVFLEQKKKRLVQW